MGENVAKILKIGNKIAKRGVNAAPSDKKQKENIKKLKSEISMLKLQIQGLTTSLDTINNMYLESAKASVDILSDLEYFRYKASFMELNIRHSSSYNKLAKYIQVISKFFLQEMKCCHIEYSYSGLNNRIREDLTRKVSKKTPPVPGFSGDRCNIYSITLVDILFPERTIGRVIVGKEPYVDIRKEKVFDKKIRSELYYVKRILENLISEIHNKELAVKDALTGLYNRKYLEEKLADHFNSVDLFSGLSATEMAVLEIIMGSEAKPYELVKAQFFDQKRTRDEVVLQKAIQVLLEKNIIWTRKEKYLSLMSDYYSFADSKKDYNLFVAMFDLDHFKDVNDNWGGHSAGDRVLMNFASIIKGYIRTTDIAVRHGGEEFMVIFSRAISFMKIREILEKIRIICEESLMVTHKGRSRNVTVSIGLTRISRYDKNIQQIISRVDKALYMAKKVRNKMVILEEEADGYRRVDM